MYYISLHRCSFWTIFPFEQVGSQRSLYVFEVIVLFFWGGGGLGWYHDERCRGEYLAIGTRHRAHSAARLHNVVRGTASSIDSSRIP